MEVKRIQRKRTRGWTMPLNTVYVGRPTIWGNPFPIITYGERALDLYRRWIWSEMSESEMATLSHNGGPNFSLADRRQRLNFVRLRGKNLACWCREESPCHADILLAIANQ